MANPTQSARSLPAFPALPKGDVLGAYETYDEALTVVDRLAKAEIEVDKV